jgi:NADH-quinone oxidoreductase E subunit
MPRAVLDDLDPKARETVARYDEKRAAVLPLLHLAQSRIGYVTPEAEEWVARWTGVPAVHVHEVVTFYTLFHTRPQGRHRILFCTSPACMLGGCEKLLEHLVRKLGIEPGQTTPDGRVTLEESECLCACEAAPMMQVDGPYHGNLDEQKIDRILDGLK